MCSRTHTPQFSTANDYNGPWQIQPKLGSKRQRPVAASENGLDDNSVIETRASQSRTRSSTEDQVRPIPAGLVQTIWSKPIPRLKAMLFTDDDPAEQRSIIYTFNDKVMIRTNLTLDSTIGLYAFAKAITDKMLKRMETIEI